MKKLIILITILITLSGAFYLGTRLVFAAEEKLPDCLQIKGTFTANNWDSDVMGETMEVGCAGDYGPGGCTGGVEKVKPGHSFSLNKCTCAPYGDPKYNKKGCLVIGKNLKMDDYVVDGHTRRRVEKAGGELPSSCKLKVKGQTYSNTGFFPTAKQYDDNNHVTYCGDNHDSISAEFTIDCESTITPPPPTVPPPPTCETDPSLCPIDTPTPTPTIPPPPTCETDPSLCPKPTVNVNNVTVNEGETANFIVSLSSSSTTTTSITVNTVSGTAVAPTDYDTKTQIITFNPGQTSKIFSVSTNTDLLIEGTEIFTVALSNPENGIIGNNGQGTIIDVPPPTYSISGNVFIDKNGDGKKCVDGKNVEDNSICGITELNYTEKSLTINNLSSSNSVNTIGGAYTFNILPAGPYTIGLSQIEIPSNYKPTTSLSRFASTGIPCSPYCDAKNNVINLNFGIKKDTALSKWIQCVGGNCMLHGKNPTPKTCDGNNNYTAIAEDTPYTSEVGLVNAFPSEFSFCPDDGSPCQELASNPKWVVGLGDNYIYEGKSGTDFATLNINATPSDGLPASGGKYLIDHGLTVNEDKTFGGNYIILVNNGDLRINANITVAGDSILLFSVKGNIIIGKDVTHIDGWYSADGKITIQGDEDTTKNKPLIVEGSLISNAAHTGSGLENLRDLGDKNETCPAPLTIKQRLDMILNAPLELAPSRRIWREITP